MNTNETDRRLAASEAEKDALVTKLLDQSFVYKVMRLAIMTFPGEIPEPFRTDFIDAKYTAIETQGECAKSGINMDEIDGQIRNISLPTNPQKALDLCRQHHIKDEYARLAIEVSSRDNEDKPGDETKS